MKSTKGILYRFIGDGKRKREVARIFQNEGEDRLEMKGYSEEKWVSRNLSRGDVLVISQKRETVGDILPSKLYSYLGAGRPILHFGPKDSDIGKMIIENDIGVIFESPSDLARVREYLLFLME